ncbi:IclR family transcriptional regulator [Phragmitibacter flavus]|uniref:IclR family transcriptional regulator n=1 Tax=Phragmitibacter flavus TaxID=2576071 RepID=A0A5R8KEZ1_9BACT|nr:IclR family transcriptional regulator [Phragmitibacter flavus]TLD70876.1 IclR family transcriptional regulator [Phragmitibacter flavus]
MKMPISSSSESIETVVVPIEQESQAPALQRGLAILELLAAADGGVTLSEISAALRLSPASIFRLTGVLEEAGYVCRCDQSRRFTLTRKLLLLGQPRQEGRGLVESCLPAMREVLLQTGETVQLCCLVGDECVLIEQLASTHPFKYLVDLGSRPPVHCCAPGKALLAFLPEEEQAAMVGRLNLVAHTPRSITDRDTMMGELAKIREAGYAVDRGEHFEGIQCVAAPVLDRHGRAVAAMTIAGPSSRVTARKFAALGAVMKQAGAAASLKYLG